MESQSTTLGANDPAQSPEGKAGRHVAWETWCLLGILVTAGVSYVWSLGATGWANAYYAGAVQSGLHDPVAFLFGSADWGNSITVDKPPLSLWVMGLSARLFGLNTWSLLLPQAAMTLGSTLLIYKLVRHSLPGRAALLAAGIFATTPITVLLARYNNPDPLMILLMLSALYAGLRAAESSRPGLLYLAAGLLALGFLAKQLQAFLVLPAILLAFILFASQTWKAKALSIGIACALLGGGSLAWPLLVDLTPADFRPYVGGSTSNSMIELTLGYNGLDRVIQHEDDPSTALIPAEMRTVDSDAGFFRLLNVNYGQEVGWLLLPALIACVAITMRVARGRYSRTGAILAMGSVVWMATTYFVLSFMGNSFHSYYTAALAAPLALCLGLATEIVLTNNESMLRRIGIAASIVASCIFSRAMWQLSDSYPEWLGSGLLFIGLISASVLLVPAPSEWIRRGALWAAIGSLVAGPVFSSAITISHPQEGSNPLSGGLTKNANSLSGFMAGIKNGSPAWAAGLAIGNTPGPELASYLGSAPRTCTWVAATYPGQTAARFQLEVARPVMPLGGFAATDPSPTLEQFQSWVKAGQVCYLVLQPEQLKVPGNSPEVNSINEWVQASFRSETIDGVRVFRLAS